MYLFIYIYVCIYIYIYICIYVYVYVCEYVYVYVYVYVYDMYMICRCIYLHLCVHVIPFISSFICFKCIRSSGSIMPSTLCCRPKLSAAALRGCRALSRLRSKTFLGGFFFRVDSHLVRESSPQLGFQPFPNGQFMTFLYIVNNIHGI